MGRRHALKLDAQTKLLDRLCQQPDLTGEPIHTKV